MRLRTFKGLCAVLAGLLPATPVMIAAPSPAAAAVPPHCLYAGELPNPSDLSTVDAATLCLVNAIRIGHHLRPLRPNSALARVAASQANGMVRQNYFADVGPTGTTPQALIAASRYPNPTGGFTIGQNLAWGSGDMSSPSAIVAAWMASPPHRSIILTSGFRDAGVGAIPMLPAVVGQPLAGATYAMEFGVRR
jgi:uncharacterized protein YkwD